MNVRTATPLAALLTVAACAPSDRTGGAAATLSDSAGIAIVENRGPWDEWRLAADPEIRIGTVEGAPSLQFHRVRFAGRLSDGRIVVADGSNQVRWFDPDGTFRTAAGRQGGGPGEFGAMTSFVLTTTDTLIVHDARNVRATWLSPAETLVRDVSLRGIPSGQTTLLAPTADGRLALSVSTTPYNELRPDFTRVRDTLGIVAASTTGVDTIARRPGSDNAIWAVFSGGQPTRMQVIGMPFAHKVTAAGTADRYAVADAGTGEIRYYDWTGELKRIARLPESTGIPLTDEDRTRFIQHGVDEARQRENPDLASIEKAARDQLSIIPDGHVMPAFADLLSDAAGRIWLRAYAPVWVDEIEYRWTVVGTDGSVERMVTTPAGLQLLHAGPEYVTGVERDSLDVEYVVVYRLVPAS